jgi:hypothetical protein
VERAKKCALEERSRQRAVDIEVHLLLWKKKASPTISSCGCRAAKEKRNESVVCCDSIPVALYCSVSRWSCRKRARRNSPCMDVLVMALQFALIGCVVDKVLQLKHNKIQPKDSFSALHPNKGQLRKSTAK